MQVTEIQATWNAVRPWAEWCGLKKLQQPYCFYAQLPAARSPALIFQLMPDGLLVPRGKPMVVCQLQGVCGSSLGQKRLRSGDAKNFKPAEVFWRCHRNQ